MSSLEPTLIKWFLNYENKEQIINTAGNAAVWCRNHMGSAKGGSGPHAKWYSGCR